MRNALIISVACLILSACSPLKKLEVGVELAPEIRIPGSLPKVAIVNMVASEASSKTYIETEFLYEGAARDGSNAVCDEFLNRLGKSGNFSLQPVQYRGDDRNAHREPAPMKTEDAQKLCAELQSDVLFVVEYFFGDLKREVNESSEPNADGKPVFVAKMTGRVEASINFFYKDENGVLQVLKPVDYAQNIDISITGSSKSDAKSNLGSSRTIVANWGSDIGRGQSDRFLSRKYDIKREFYVGKTPDFKQAFKLLKDVKTEEALKLVTPLTNNTSKQLRDQAWFNKAVIAEMQGDRTKALEYVSKSDLKEAYAYKSALKAILE
ncbi:MAG: hypothetical protein A2W93_02785 [Bacteroidetes bacterium GWF2_43_63]|nr:MAG: hypothetical protein A2W94_08790 [Bacteroidetes bacterium GWE2_42_42]OFY53593.1 MAG: hypothetical protein A2W93_02785 [Bacteroidetes bacterium GWF2_43_63]HBG71073.1 hypothetical protein [Bacteroidales bacterium]HCB63651.1 hypothetical protein [Bacteroidales bacterium]HCY24400.1 hypothetical protein [Bacteroidales bacterium]